MLKAVLVGVGNSIVTWAWKLLLTRVFNWHPLALSEFVGLGLLLLGLALVNVVYCVVEIRLLEIFFHWQNSPAPVEFVGCVFIELAATKPEVFGDSRTLWLDLLHIMPAKFTTPRLSSFELVRAAVLARSVDALLLEMRSAAERGVWGIPEEPLKEAVCVSRLVSIAMVDRIHPCLGFFLLLLNHLLGVSLELNQVGLLIEEWLVLWLIFKLNRVHKFCFAEARDTKGLVLIATKRRPFHSSNEALGAINLYAATQIAVGIKQL